MPAKQWILKCRESPRDGDYDIEVLIDRAVLEDDYKQPSMTERRQHSARSPVHPIHVSTTVPAVAAAPTIHTLEAAEGTRLEELPPLSESLRVGIMRTRKAKEPLNYGVSWMSFLVTSVENVLTCFAELQ